MNKNIQSSSIILIIILLGFLFRLGFLLFGAEAYFGTKNFFVNGDSPSYLNSFINLIESGTYTANEKYRAALFCRTPTYAFFLGFIYLLVGKNSHLTYEIAVHVQIFIDLLSVYIIYLVSGNIFNKKTGFIAAFIYAMYPMAVIWTSTAYSETLTIFLMLSTILFLIKGLENLNKKQLFFSGILMALTVLCRTQMLFLLIAIITAYFLFSVLHLRKYSRESGFFLIGFIVVYSMWPIRNYVFHKEIIFTQTFVPPTYSEDVMSGHKFLGYILPNEKAYENFMAIIRNEELVLPSFALSDKQDSSLIMNTIENAKNHGYGYSNFGEYWKEKRPNNTDSLIVIRDNFNYLSNQMMKKYPIEVFVKVPLQNLNKMFFKSALTKNNFSKIYSQMAFLFRTLLLLTGIVYLYNFLYKEYWQKTHSYYIAVFYVFFSGWYFFMAFGPYRNLEIRYLLYCDVLLLIPAAQLIYIVIKKINSENINSTSNI
jgi:hypothetical protein